MGQNVQTEATGKDGSFTQGMIEKIITEVATSIAAGPLADLQRKFNATEDRMASLEAQARTLVAAARRHRRCHTADEETSRRIELETGGGVGGEAVVGGETGGSGDMPGYGETGGSGDGSFTVEV